jgi:hypothetical protein
MLEDDRVTMDVAEELELMDIMVILQEATLGNRNTLMRL